MMMSHYKITGRDDIGVNELKEMFGSDHHGPCADEFNWLFLATSGIHGSLLTLDDIHADVKSGKKPDVTYLVVRPRRVEMVYGNVRVTSEEEERSLRRLVSTTIAAISESQAGCRTTL